MRITPETSWWWKPSHSPKIWLQLQLGISVDWEPPLLTIGVDLVIVRLGLRFDWSVG